MNGVCQNLLSRGLNILLKHLICDIEYSDLPNHICLCIATGFESVIEVLSSNGHSTNLL